MATLKQFANSFKMKETASCIFVLDGEEIEFQVRYFGDQFMHLPQYQARKHSKDFTDTKILVKDSKVKKATKGDSPLLLGITEDFDEDVNWIAKFLIVDWKGFVDENGEPEIYSPEKFKELIGFDRKSGERMVQYIFNFAIVPENFRDSGEAPEVVRKEADAKN